jgi:hypothetical protein
MVDFFIAEKIISRSHFTIDKNKVAKNILVQGKPVQKKLFIM